MGASITFVLGEGERGWTYIFMAVYYEHTLFECAVGVKQGTKKWEGQLNYLWYIVFAYGFVYLGNLVLILG